MNRPILDRFLQRAAEVAEVADLVQSGDPNGRSIFTLQPLREGAAPVIVSTWKGSDAHEIEYGVPFCEAESLDGPVEVDLEIVDDYVDTAIDGRLWVAFGLDRGLLGIISSTGVESRVTTYDGLRSLIPLPGWKKRAKKRRYLPYLS